MKYWIVSTSLTRHYQSNYCKKEFKFRFLLLLIVNWKKNGWLHIVLELSRVINEKLKINNDSYVWVLIIEHELQNSHDHLVAKPILWNHLPKILLMNKFILSDSHSLSQSRVSFNKLNEPSIIHIPSSWVIFDMRTHLGCIEWGRIQWIKSSGKYITTINWQYFNFFGICILSYLHIICCYSHSHKVSILLNETCKYFWRFLFLKL